MGEATRGRRASEGEAIAPLPLPGRRLPWAYVALASLAFATSAPLTKLAAPTPPLTIALGRTALSALILALVARRTLVGSILRLSSADRSRLLFAGVALALHFALYIAGIGATSLPAAVTLISLQPLYVVLVAWGLFGMRPARAEVAGVALATAGALLVARGAGVGEHRLAGDLLVLLAAALYGFYVAAARRLAHALPALDHAALVYAVAATTLLALALLSGDLGATLSPRATASIVGLALLPTIVGHTSVLWAARRFSPAVVALVSPGETVGALALGAFLLGLTPGSWELAGAVVVLAGTTVALVGSAAVRGDATTGPA